MEQPASVRWATHADEPAIYDLLVELHRHNSFGWGFAFDPTTVLSQIEAATRQDPAKRTNPRDQRRGAIGVIDGPDGKLIGSVGLFLIPPMWFSTWSSVTELWLFIRPEARDRQRYERDLFDFARWFHHSLLSQPSMADSRMPFWLLSGFMHVDNQKRPRFEAMDRLWRRLCRGQKIGSLYRAE